MVCTTGSSFRCADGVRRQLWAVQAEIHSSGNKLRSAAMKGAFLISTYGFDLACPEP